MSNKVPRSRILIIGKANAGKTSILKKICGDADIPIVHDRNGKRVIALESLDPTTGRGLHNVENEITYPSSPQFAFHDSRGIEAASITEINRLADFISRRGSSAMSWEQRLHATWICLPLDDERPLSEAEMRMITLNPDEVPVVVVFTKYDGLETRAFNKIHREGGMSLREAYRAMKGAAERLFKEQWLERIYPTEPPKPPFVRLKDLHKPEGSCEELMQCTENVLKNNQPAHKMFILAQKYKLEKRLKHALPDAIKFLLGEIGHRGQDSLDDLVKRVLTWMPHVYQRTYNDALLDEQNRFYQEAPDHVLSEFVAALRYTGPLQNNESQRLLQVMAGCAIVSDYCFWITKRHENKTISRSGLMIGRQCALQAYQSHHQEAVMNAIVKGFPGTDVLSRSLAAMKNLDKGKGSGEEAKDLSDKLHDIVLEHRMPKNLDPDPPESSGST